MSDLKSVLKCKVWCYGEKLETLVPNFQFSPPVWFNSTNSMSFGIKWLIFHLSVVNDWFSHTWLANVNRTVKSRTLIVKLSYNINRRIRYITIKADVPDRSALSFDCAIKPVVRNLFIFNVYASCGQKQSQKQESPPAWTQEAYRPPRSKCSLCWWGGGTPSSHGGVPHSVMVGGTLGPLYHPDLAWGTPPPSRPGPGGTWGTPPPSRKISWNTHTYIHTHTAHMHTHTCVHICRHKKETDKERKK